MKKFTTRFKEEINYIVDSHIKNRDWTLQEVGQFWDSVADYDDINEQTYSYFRRFVDGYALCGIPDNSYILDICARTGNGTKYFYERGKVKKAVCADVSIVFQNICAENLKKHNIPFDTLLFDNYRLPFRNDEFDAIICFETIEHFSQTRTYLKELYRLLIPGGEMVLTCPNILWEPIHSLAAVTNFHHSEGLHRFIRRSVLRSHIQNAGFSILREDSSVIVPGGPKKLISLGEYLEKKLPFGITSLLALRRILICKKP